MKTSSSVSQKITISQKTSQKKRMVSAQNVRPVKSIVISMHSILAWASVFDVLLHQWDFIICKPSSSKLGEIKV